MMNDNLNNVINKAKQNSLGVSPNASAIEAWLVSHLSSILEIDSQEIDTTLPFEYYGLDSEAAVVMSGDLQEWLGCELDATLLLDYPTIEALVEYLAQPQ